MAIELVEGEPAFVIRLIGEKGADLLLVIHWNHLHSKVTRLTG
jgi:hypothetical protein